MRAEFYRADDRDRVVGTARFTARGVSIEAEDDRSRETLGRVFVATPVSIDDASLRQAGTSGPTVFPPGSLPWFLSAARSRSGIEGLGVRFVPEEELSIGWDPAGAYRPFADALARRVRLEETPDREAGETRPEGEVGPSASGTEAARPGPAPSAAGTSDATR